jgi:hypothetical protein
MEIIPILSTIILVATICTFILSVGAYILYKVREKRHKGSTAVYEREVPAELIAPEIINKTQVEDFKKSVPFRSDKKRTVVNQQVTKSKESVSSIKVEELTKKENILKKNEIRELVNQRFMKYTSQGYKPAKDDEDLGKAIWN